MPNNKENVDIVNPSYKQRLRTAASDEGMIFLNDCLGSAKKSSSKLISTLSDLFWDWLKDTINRNLSA